MEVPALDTENYDFLSYLFLISLKKLMEDGQLHKKLFLTRGQYFQNKKVVHMPLPRILDKNPSKKFSFTSKLEAIVWEYSVKKMFLKNVTTVTGKFMCSSTFLQ